MSEVVTTRWESAQVSSNGITLHYHRTGGDGPVLLLLHGFSDNGLCWRRVSLELEADYDILMLDARGHGLSDAPEKGYSSEELAADVAGLIMALDLGRVLILGHSVGAVTAAVVVANYPQLVRAVALEDPIWREASDSRNSYRHEQREEISETVRQQLLSQQQMNRSQIEASGRERCPDWHADEFPDWVDSKQQVSPHAVEALVTYSKDWQTLTKNIQSPLLLLTGEQSKGAITSQAVAEEVQSINVLVQQVPISNAGHNIRREGFDEYLSAVKCFFNEVS